MKRFSKKVIYYGMVNSLLLGILLLFLIPIAVNEDFTINFKVLIIFLVSDMAFILVITAYHILYYRLSGYEIKDNTIYCQRGVIFKKKSILNYSKINSVNKKQGLIQKLFGIATLMVDSGSTNTAAQAEIMIIEELGVVNKLYDILKNKENFSTLENDSLAGAAQNNIEQEGLYKFDTKGKLLYSIIISLYLLILAFFISSFIFVILYLCYKFPEMNDESFELSLIQIVVGSIILYFSIILLGWLLSIGCTFIGYYNFKITKEDNNINVEYGLFVNKHNSFSLDKVKAVIIHQNIFQRIFKFAQIRVEVIGYVEQSADNKQGVIGILIPLCKLSEVDSYLEKIIPTHIPKSQKGHAISFISFISWTSIFVGIADVLILVLAIIFLAYNNLLFELLIVSLSVIGFSLLTILFTIINALFAYRIKDVIIDDTNVTIYNGSFTKKITVINKKDIIAIEDITTAFRAKKGIYSYLIHFHTNSFSNVIYVAFKEEGLREELLGVMKY